jgi:hypothetical protein
MKSPLLRSALVAAFVVLPLGGLRYCRAQPQLDGPERLPPVNQEAVGQPFVPQNYPPTPAPLFESGDEVPDWTWQGLPEGLMWRSYLAGVKEPRFGLVTSHTRRFGTTWDATLGGRVAMVRYGTNTAYRPEGWELDLEGAAMPRLEPLEISSPVVSTDFRVGVPVTYASGQWQFKTGYYHLSAHLGDEFMLLNPSAVRINYTRDAIMLGVGYFYTDALRLYGEYDYAFVLGGGSKPSQFQFGIDYSPPVRGGAPFAAVYTNLLQELDFGGFFVVQAGWQYRGGAALHTFRLGVEYVNGANSQYEFFNTFEQRVGFGIWYDY